MPSSATFTVRILRQDKPGETRYWDEFQVEHEPA